MSAELLEQHPFIYAGINLEKIYELNLHSRTFTADGEIWLEWLPNVDKLLKANNTDPAELIHLTNRIETWDSTFEPTTKTPTELSGGRHQQSYHFSSRFYDTSAALRISAAASIRFALAPTCSWRSKSKACLNRWTCERCRGCLKGWVCSRLPKTKPWSAWKRCLERWWGFGVLRIPPA